jgi:hypothetical protein
MVQHGLPLCLAVIVHCIVLILIIFARQLTDRVLHFEATLSTIQLDRMLFEDKWNEPHTWDRRSPLDRFTSQEVTTVSSAPSFRQASISRLARIFAQTIEVSLM